MGRLVVLLVRKSKSQQNKYISCIVSRPVTAVRRTGLHHSGKIPAPTFMYRATLRATNGIRNRAMIVLSWRLVAVVPAQCQRRPSHQKVGAILTPMLLAGQSNLPPLKGT